MSAKCTKVNAQMDFLQRESYEYVSLGKTEQWDKERHAEKEWERGVQMGFGRGIFRLLCKRGDSLPMS